MRGCWLLFALLMGCTRKDTPAADAPLGFVPTAAAATPAPREAQAAPAVPRFVGRWLREGDAMRCGWSGCYVAARFKGTAVSARIKDEGRNYFHVIIDGEEKKVLKTDGTKGEVVHTLAEGLPDGVHEISLHRRTEARNGESLFYGFEFPNGGKMVALSPVPERRIETIGDSITAGYGNEGTRGDGTCTYVPNEENEYATYAAIAARNLGADHTTIAWSGKTIYEMHGYFDKVLPQRTDGPVWDYAQYQPHVVVVNLGTNNFANVDPGEARFVRVYQSLIRDVRAAYPKAFIVCALGSMLSNIYPPGRNALTQARKYMKVTVAKLKEAGDTNLDLLEFPEQDHANGLGCGFHPSLKTHKLMSDQLTAFIKERMGW